MTPAAATHSRQGALESTLTRVSTRATAAASRCHVLNPSGRVNPRPGE